MSAEQRSSGAAAAAAMIVVMDFARVPRDEFDDWLDLEHIPQRGALPGFTGTERWLAIDGPSTSVVLYGLESLSVLTGAPYASVTGANLSPWSRRIIGRCNRRRYEADLTLHLVKQGVERAEGLLLVAMNVEPEAEDEFDRWYSEEHLPRLFELPGVLDARRYRAAVGDQKHLALYHLADPDVQAPPAWKQAVDTPWGSRVRPHTRDRARWVCARYRRRSD
jgi:hypothetical protein